MKMAKCGGNSKSKSGTGTGKKGGKKKGGKC